MRDASALALQMGHTGTDLIFAHYREVVHPSKGEEYFKIMPGSRLETVKVHAFQPNSYRWSLHVFNCEDEWLNGPTELARYFGVSIQAPRYWFKNPKAPALREDGNFHVPTWRAFVEKYTPSGRKNQRGEERKFFTALGEQGLCAREKRVYFATREEAQAYADRENAARLAKAMRAPVLDAKMLAFKAAVATPKDTPNVAL